MGHTLYNRVYAAGFGFKEAGLKLDVTMWVPRFTQSVYMTASKSRKFRSVFA